MPSREPSSNGAGSGPATFAEYAVLVAMLTLALVGTVIFVGWIVDQRALVKLGAEEAEAESP